MAKYVRKPKVNIPMCAAAVLFCLTVISTHLVSGLYARYTTSGSGADEARVIKFGQIEIVESGAFINENKEMMIIPGVDIEKKAAVNFGGSEAATYVFVEVALSEIWTMTTATVDEKPVYTFCVPVKDFGDVLVWNIAEGWTHLPVTGDSYVFYRALKPNTILDHADIIAGEKIAVSEEITKSVMSKIETLAGESKKLPITFRATVVQSHGFDSVEAAWASLSAKEGAA